MENLNNTYNDQNELNELDDLRQQINELKNKVDEQGRLNEALVKKTIQGKMRGVQRVIYRIAIIAIIVTPLFIMMHFQMGLSWPLVICSILLMLGCVCADYFINRMDVNHMGDNLVETAHKLAQMKKNRSLSQKIGIGLCIPWLAWFCYEFYQYNLINYGEKAALYSILSPLIGVVIGGLIGLAIYNKMQRTNDEMIDQINEFMQEQ